jgi:hypothetical protein
MVAVERSPPVPAPRPGTGDRARIAGELPRITGTPGEAPLPLIARPDGLRLNRHTKMLGACAAPVAGCGLLCTLNAR